MIKKLQFYISKTVDPYVNLAVEQFLFENVDNETLILYLWQNQNTVVIGKNQNAYSECRTELLKEDGCILARRMSGGGAVFHDMGNLNFTFICSSENLDVSKHMQVIREACRLAGIDAEISGRNDILVNGRKFSGNAFYNSRGRSYHHGTIMVSADTEKLGKYLTPPKAKLEAKGVKSVRSRVINLSEIAPALTCDIMKEHFMAATKTVYSLPSEFIGDVRGEQIDRYAKDFADWEHIYGSPIPFNFSCGGKLSFGNAELELCVKGGRIVDLKMYTDSLDTDISDKVGRALLFCTFDLAAIEEALQGVLDEADVVSFVSMLADQIF